MNNKKNSFTVRIAAIEQFYIALNYIEKKSHEPIDRNMHVKKCLVLSHHKNSEIL